MGSLEDRHRQWGEAVNARDLDGYADIVAEDVVWIPPHGDAIVGRQAFRGWLEPFFGQYAYDYSSSGNRFLDAGDWIAEHGDFESRMTPLAGGEAMVHTGSYLVLWKHGPDGVWRIDRYVDMGALRTT